MGSKAKRFRVGTEGQTTDGRTITGDWLRQIAATYDPAKYGARIWLEHLRGIMPDGPFRAYGDVRALSVDTGADGKLALFAEIDPTPDLIAMNKARQKVYSSMEIDPDFAGTGQAYLVGLGITDSPASLGTEMLAFAAGATANPLAARKQRPENLFAAAIETDLADLEAPPADEGGLLERLKVLLSGAAPKQPQTPHPSDADLRAGLALLASQIRTDGETAAASLAALKADLAAVRAEFAALQSALDTTPKTPPRTPATGSGAPITTDC